MKISTQKALYKALFTIILAACWNFTSNAQCDVLVNSAYATPTPADCPSNGKIQIATTAGNVNDGFLYQIIEGPAGGGFPTNSVSNSLFESLPPGDYSIQVTCGTSQKTVTATVLNEYTLLNMTVNVDNKICDNGEATAQITATATGGKGALIYGVIKSNNANAPDNLFDYQSSPIFNVVGAGNYQVRVKDECNNYITYGVTVSPSVPIARALVAWTNKACGSSGPTLSVRFNLFNPSTNSPIPFENSGYTIELFDATELVGCPSNTSGLTPFQSQTINQESDLDFVNIPSTYGRVLIKTTSPCGLSDVYCLDVPDLTMQFRAVYNIACVSSGNSNVNLSIDGWNFVGPAVLTISGKNEGDSEYVLIKSGTINYTWEMIAFGNNLDEYDSYELILTDDCGSTETLIVNRPTPLDGNSSWINGIDLWCVSEIGTVSLSVVINGNVPGVGYSPLVELLNGDDVVAVATDYYQPSNTFNFKNVPPGTYTVRVSSNASYPSQGCITTIESPLVVPENDDVLKFDLSATKEELCGGNATISGVLDYNGSGSITFELSNESGFSSTNTIGTFANIPPGEYTLKATSGMYNTCGNPDIIRTTHVSVIEEDSYPKVTKVLGVLCETEDDFADTGSAIFQFSGFGPFVVEITKRTSPAASSPDFIYNDVPESWTLNNLEPYATYDIRIIDQCGKTAVTEVTIKPLLVINTTNADQPCFEKEFRFGVEDMINAQYSWTKDGQDMGINTREITIDSYNSSVDDGVYVCTISLADGCIIRNVAITLEGKNCSLPVTLTKFTGFAENNSVILHWETVTEINSSYFAIEKSKDAKSWNLVGKVNTTGNNSVYSLKDEYPFNGENYYRLKMVDLAGTFEYSSMVSVSMDVENELVIYPNPAFGQEVRVKGVEQNLIKKIELINQSGAVEIEQFKATLSTKNLKPGLYFVKIHFINGSFQIKKLLVD